MFSTYVCLALLTNTPVNVSCVTFGMGSWLNVNSLKRILLMQTSRENDTRRCSEAMANVCTSMNARC